MEDFDKLKKIGIQKIHEATHISRKYVESILNERFEDMTRVQFVGFISILEREYSLDLDDLKEKALGYYEANKKEQISEDNIEVFTTSHKKNLTPIYITLALIIFLSFLFFNKFFEDRAPEVIRVDNSTIDSAKHNISIKIEDNTTENNETNSPISDVNNSIVENVEEQMVGLKKEETSLKIIPKNRVWLGYIEVDTNKKRQKTFSDEFDLNSSKDWLLLFGHGYITLDVNGKTTEYKTMKNLRFLYENSELKEITREEFKALNKGDEW